MPPTSRPRGRPKSFHDKSAQNTIRSLDRALDVLDVLAGSGGLTLTEISDGMGQSPATIYRVLSTFQARGVVETDPATQTWHVGPAAFRLGSAFLRRTSVIERSRPVMRDLVGQTGETANLGIEAGDMVLFVSQVETHHSIRAFFPPGTRSPMHASGIGKALLSRYEPDRLHRHLRDHPLERFTDATITDRDRLLEDLAAIRARGYAIDDEERTKGMRCIAAPVMNFFGEAVAGISVSGPSDRVTPETLDRVGDQVSAAARTLSGNLGAPDPA